MTPRSSVDASQRTEMPVFVVPAHSIPCGTDGACVSATGVGDGEGVEVGVGVGVGEHALVLVVPVAYARSDSLPAASNAVSPIS